MRRPGYASNATAPAAATASQMNIVRRPVLSPSLRTAF
jgi:hypothetical protein